MSENKKCGDCRYNGEAGPHGTCMICVLKSRFEASIPEFVGEAKQFDESDYTDLAARTDAPLTAELLHRLTNPQTVELLHAALGMVTEAAELADMLKKHIYANKPLDLVNVGEEAGDELWYVAKALRAIKMTMKDCKQMNLDKLRLRFSDKFSEEKSLGRNTGAEREFLVAAIEQMEETRLLPKALSQRGQDFQRFSRQVLDHIENYTVPQYGDKGSDRATDYDVRDIAEQIGRYKDRMGTNARGDVESKRDFLKIAHYASLGWAMPSLPYEEDPRSENFRD